MQNSEFEWDDEKAKSNFNKHGVSFEGSLQISGEMMR